MAGGKFLKKFKSMAVLIAVAAAALPLLFPLRPLGAQGSASLYFSPKQGTYVVGERFSVGVYVSSFEQAMNAFEAVVKFPADKLEATGFSKNGLATNLFVYEPSFDNSKGVINIAGAVFNPGYQGGAGKLVVINFRAKAAGATALAFSSASVLANDGFGTDIFASSGTASFNIVAASAAPAPAVGELPSKPIISSTTHPDYAKWYSSKEGKFDWPMPPGISGTSVIVDRYAETLPDTKSEGLISSYAVKDLADGIWYIHGRTRNNAGWGPAVHYKFNIDTEIPHKLEITEIVREDKTGPQPRFTIEAADKTSGMDKILIKIDDGEEIVWIDDGSHIFAAPVLEAGERRLIAKAVDLAGNLLEKFVDFKIEALAPPQITGWPRQLKKNKPLEVSGTASPDSTVMIFFQRENEKPAVRQTMSNQKGFFVHIFDGRLQEGVYKIWATVVDERGAKSPPSGTVITKVQPSFLSWNILILVLLLALLIIWWLLIPWKRRARKEIKQAASSLHQSFDVLRHDAREQLKLLEQVKLKRKLTREEEKTLKKLQKDLNLAEAVIKKEINHVKKQIK